MNPGLRSTHRTFAGNASPGAARDGPGQPGPNDPNRGIQALSVLPDAAFEHQYVEGEFTGGFHRLGAGDEQTAVL